jgi:glycosyltransferase involved in cell wall biosynthesis
LNEKNYGPYACRNYALGIAKGKYITFLDADDTIDEDHILLLLSCIKKRNLIGVISLYNRYSTSGKKVKGPNICEASIMFDIKDVLKNIGYYHMVRCGGDTEFRERMAKHYERSRMGVFYHTTYSALYSKASLTRSPKLGGGTKARQEYAGAFRRWHKGGDSLFFDYRTMDMPFDLNKEIRVTGFNTKSFKGVKR